MVDFTIFQGDEFKYTLTLKDSDDSAIDITGYKFYMTVKSALSDADADAVIKSEFSPSDATNGQVIINLTSTETSGLDVSDSTTNYVYDIRMIDDSSQDTVLLDGKLTIRQPVTRSTSL